MCVCVCWERGQVGISMVAERYLKPVLGRILALPQVLSPTAERERERGMEAVLIKPLLPTTFPAQTLLRQMGVLSTSNEDLLCADICWASTCQPAFIPSPNKRHHNRRVACRRCSVSFFLYFEKSTCTSSWIRSLLILDRIGLPSSLLSCPAKLLPLHSARCGALGTHQDHYEKEHHEIHSGICSQDVVSRILFIRSHGVFLLIIVPGSVITTLRDWIFMILMDSVNFTVVTGKLNT